MTTKEHKEKMLNELAKLKIEDNFVIPDGLIIPFSNKVLIKKVHQSAMKTDSGIVLAQSSDTSRSTHGVVMAIGVGVDLEQYPIKLGMKVEFTIGLTEDTFHKGISYLCVDQYHIKGAIPEGNYKFPYFPTNLEKRRQMNIDNTKLAKKVTDKRIDKILHK